MGLRGAMKHILILFCLILFWVPQVQGYRMSRVSDPELLRAYEFHKQVAQAQQLENSDQLLKIVGGHFDFNEFINRVLHEMAYELTPEQLVELQNLFHKLFYYDLKHKKIKLVKDVFEDPFIVKDKLAKGITKVRIFGGIKYTPKNLSLYYNKIGKVFDVKNQKGLLSAFYRKMLNRLFIKKGLKGIREFVAKQVGQN